MSRIKEIAKFACGAEAFHAFIHAYFWASGTTIQALGMKETPATHRRAAIGNTVVALALTVYASGAPDARPLESGVGAEDRRPVTE